MNGDVEEWRWRFSVGEYIRMTVLLALCNCRTVYRGGVSHLAR